ncbi:MAG: nitrite reductase (NO-forming) [Akkermansiaceae bacterium]|jgi:nitrite reductase (NO-forming)
MVYSGKMDDRIGLLEGGAIQEIPQASSTPAPAANKDERVARGKNKYTAICMACHQATGAGIPEAFPPLAKSDYLNGSKSNSISAVVHGLAGEVEVNGQKFNSIMPKLELSDEDVANVLTYVYSQRGKNGSEVTHEEVKAVRALPPVPLYTTDKTARKVATFRLDVTSVTKRAFLDFVTENPK